MIIETTSFAVSIIFEGFSIEYSRHIGYNQCVFPGKICKACKGGDQGEKTDT